MNAYTIELQRLYLAFFNRPADPDGLAYWERERANGKSLESIAAFFSNTGSFISSLPNQSSAAVVNMMFLNLFGHPADQFVQLHWGNKLDSGELSRGSLALAIVNAAQGNDQIVETKKTTAAQAFTDSLITPEQKIGYLGEKAFAIARTWLTKVDGSDASVIIAKNNIPSVVIEILDASSGRVSVSGVVVDGLIKGATVFADANGNGVWDMGEAKGTSDAFGHFTLTRARGTLIASGGQDISTGSTPAGSYSAPAGSSVISPLTTLVQVISTSNNISAEQAEAIVKAKLGIAASVSIGHFDPVAEAGKPGASAAAVAIAVKVFSVAAQVNTIMGQVGALLSGVGVSADTKVGSENAIKSLAKMISGANNTIDLGASNNAEQLIRVAAISGGATPTQITAINTILVSSGQVLATLNHTIQLASVDSTSSSGKTNLVEIAKIQYVAETVKTAMENGASSQDLSQATSLVIPSSLKKALATASGNIGDVDGDATSDAIADTTAPTTTVTTMAFSADTGVSGTDFNTNTALQTISGTTSANLAHDEIIEVSIDNGSVWTPATTNMDSNTWSLAGVTLTGSNTLKVRVSDIVGNNGTVSTQAYVLDTTAPSTTIASMTFSADTGTSGTDLKTKTAAQTISGTTSANLVSGEIVEVSIDNGSTWSTATTSVGANTWSLAGATLTGSNTLKVRVTDTAGNSGTTASQAYVLDTTAPSTTIASMAFSADTGAWNTDFITATAAQTISGTTSANIAAGEIVEVSIDNGGTWSTATTSVGANTWSLAGVTLTGSNTLKVRVSDTTGNSGAIASQAYVLDTTAPSTTIASTAFSADTGASNTDFITATAAQTISGTTSANIAAGEIVEVSINNGSTWSTATTSVGANTWSLAGVTLTGSNTLKVRVSDTTGNSGTIASQAYVLDTTAPTTTIASMAFAADTGASNTDFITATAAQTISGTTSANLVSGEIVEVSINNGGTWSTATTSVGANTWSLAGVTLTGSNTIKVRVSDTTGNSGTIASQAYVLDTTAPNTTIATMAFSADTGASNTDFITATAAQTISGTTSANIAAGEIVEVSIDNGGTWSTATTSVGANTWSLAGVTLTGSNTLKVRVSDTTGNSGTTASQAYVLDTTAPSTTIATAAFSADTGTSGTDFNTKTAAQTISGTTSANITVGEIVEVSLNNGSTWSTATTSVGANTWSLAGVTLTGSNTLKVRVSDTTGNSGAIASQAYVLDTTAPTTTIATMAFSADTGASNSDFITATAAQTISGTTSANIAAGEIVEVSINNGGTWSTATTSVGANTWSLAGVTLTGSNTLKVRVSDTTGNSGAIASQAYVLDTTAPSTTIASMAFSADTGASNTDFITATAAQTISGTTSANLVSGEIVEVSINNGGTWTTATTSVGANTWSLAGVTLTASNTMKVRVSDTTGNSGTIASQAYVLDTTAPTTTIASMAFSADTGASNTDFITATAAQTISGTTSANIAAGEIVEVSINNGSTWSTATTSVGANTWSLAGVTLTGSNTLKVRVSDTTGNSGTTASQAYVLDTTAPSTTIATAAFSADTGTSGTDFNTKTAAQTISGTTSANIAAGEIVEVSIDNGSTWSTATTSVGANTWSLAGATLTGSNTLKVRVTDTAGNSGTTASQAYVLDTTAPTTTIASMAFSADTGASNTDFITATAAQTISGTTSANIAAGEIVEVSIDNGGTWSTATTSVGANTWSLAGVTLTGSNTLKVRVTDTAGNSGTIASQAYVLDTTAPSTTIASMAFSADTGASGADFITATAAQTISGTTSANLVSGEIVEVSINNGGTWTTATTSVGANTWSLAGVTLTGSNTLKVRVTDTAGNSGTTASQAYVLDTTAPTTTIASMAFSADTGASNTDFITATAAQTISGTTSANIAAGEIVEVSIDNGGTWSTATTSVGANTWSLAGVTLTASNTLKVRVSDTTGNSGTIASQAYVLDTTAPTTTIATIAFSADTGASNSDFITATATQTISGTTSANIAAGEIVEVSIDNGSTWSTATTSVGANTWSLAGVTLTGSNTLKVRVSDTTGNSGTIASQAYVLDTTAPTTTIATIAFSADTGASNTDFITATAAQTISGTTSANIAAGEIVEVSIDNGSTWSTATTSVGANTWSLAGVTLTGSNTLKVRVTDTAGNSGTTASQAYVLDTTAPTTTIATMAFSADTGASNTDFITATAAQTISGTTSANIAAGEIVEVSIDNGSTWSTATTSVGANTWSLAGVTLTASNTLKVRVTDTAGNSGTTASQAYVLDTTAPTTTIATMAFSADTGASNSDFITATAAQTISGTTSANLVSGEIVEVSIDNGSTWSTATTSVGANTWSLAGVTLTGSNTMKVRVSDTTGNSGTIASQAYVLDTTAPTTTIATMAFSADTGASNSDFITATAAQTISGTTSANIAAGEIVEVSINNGGTWSTATTSVGANTWSLAGVTLTGSNTLKVRVSDTTGNSDAIASQAYVLDTTAPSTTIASMAFSADTGASNTDFITATAAQTISGTTSANLVSGEIVEVSIDNGSTWSTATTSVGANTWSLAGVTLTGSNTLKVRVSDTTGNSGTTASQAYVLDTTAPSTTIATAAFSADTGTSGTDFNTKTAAQTISGTTSANIAAGEIVEVSIDNGSTWSTATTSVGANTWSLAGATLTGSNTLKVRVSDTTGNSGTIASQAYVLDTTAPSTTIATMAFSADTGASNTDFITATAAQTISGTTSANLVSGEIVEVSIDNGSTWSTATTSVGANTWSLAGVTLTASNTMKVRVTDTAGNSGTIASQVYVLNTTAPTTTIATMAFSADTGASGADFITATAAQTISGTTSANLVSGEIVEVSIDNGSTWSTATTSVGANTWSLAGVTLTGSNTLKVRVSNTTGNSGTIASQAYVLDTTAPSTTIATAAFSADTGTSGTDFNTKTAAQTISGTTSANIAAGEIVEVSIDNGSTWSTSTTSVGANTWSLAGVTLTGSNTLKVRVTDTAGNSGTTASQAYVLDTTAPTTTIATMAFSADTGASNTDFITATAAQTISGTTSANIAAGEIVEVSIDNGSTWSTATTSVGANTWSLAGVTLTASNTMKVRVTDTAGNSGTTASQAYVLDTTPVATTYTLTAGNDTVTAGGADDTINGTVSGAFSGTDALDGGGGNDSLNVTDSSNLSTTGTTVVNVETASLTSSGTVNAVTTAWTGLNALTVSAVGAVTMNCGVTALDVTETNAGQLTSDIVIDGGSTVTVASIHQGSGLITIGGTTAPTSTVTITTSADAGQTGGAITVNGGTTVSVTQSTTHAVGTTVTAESAVMINGGGATTTVTVAQPSVVAAANAVSAVTGVSAVNAVTAAPGTQPVTAVTPVVAVNAVTAVAGVAANGAVTIIDSKYNTATANTISTVTLSSYGAGSAIRSNALTTLSLSGTAGTLAITNATNGAGAVPSANTTLALILSGLSGVSNTITDTNNEISTLNVTTTGADSTLAAFADTGLTMLSVAGSQVLRLNSMNSSLTSITVSGSAGFNDGSTFSGVGFSTRGAAATFTTTSSGPINISINATTQTFTGSTGVDTIRISSKVDATQTVTGGSSGSDELIIEGGAYALTAATGAKVTGFETLGISANVTGTIDMSNMASGFTKFHIIGNSSVAVTKVSNNANLQIDKASTQVTMVYADATGPADTINVSLGTATSDGVNFGTLIFKDSVSVGIGTVNVVSNGVNITAGDAVANFNTMVITDNGLSNLNVSGTQGLKITTINQATSQATSFTLNNTNTGSAGVTIGVLTDSKLTSLNFAGTGTSMITTLTASTTTSLAIDNSGTKMATVKAMTSSANLRNLNLSGNVQIGDGLVTGTGMTLTYTQGLSIDGTTDHAHVKLTMAGAGSGYVDNISLGNGNNTVTNVSTAGTINVTLGTGSNYITLGGATTNSTGRYNITVGAGSAPDYITVGTGGSTYASTPNYVITGLQVGDRISFNADSLSSANALTATAPGASVAQTISAIEAAAAFAHGVAYAVYGGNTYVAESASGTLGGTDTTIIQLVGVYTLTASTGFITIA